MSRINQQTAWQRSRPGPAFSNSTEWEDVATCPTPQGPPA